MSVYKRVCVKRELVESAGGRAREMLDRFFHPLHFFHYEAKGRQK
jgi:hypothetical protein